MSDTFPNDVWRLICAELATRDVRTLARLQRCSKRFKFIFAGLTRISLTSIKDIPRSNNIAVNIISQLARLQSLSLAKCSNINFSFLIGVGPLLTELDVSNNLRINPTSLALIGQACPRLRILNITGCRKIDDLAVAAFCCPNLFIDPEVTDVSKLNAQITPYTSLHTLGIRGCFLLTTAAVDLLSRRFIGLTSLDMGGLPNVLSDAFAHLSRLNGLKDINLRSAKQTIKDITDSKFNPIMNALPIEKLNLIDSPASFLRFNYSCASLRVLDLQNAGISDLQLINICNASPQLEELNIMSCAAISDQAMICVGNLTKLRRLEVKELSLLTSNAFVQIFQSLKHLQVVNISRNPGISDDVLEQLCANSGHSLITLNVQQCTTITDIGIAIVAKNCPKLSIINLDDVPIGDDTIINLIEARKRTLQHLNIAGTSSRNTKLIMAALESHCPFIFKVVVPIIDEFVASFKTNHPFSIVKAGSP